MKNACWILLFAVWTVTGLTLVRIAGPIVRPAISLDLQTAPSDAVLYLDAALEHPTNSLTHGWR